MRNVLNTAVVVEETEKIYCDERNNKMKYLFVNSSLTNGGSERVMSIIANQFAKNEYDTSMLLLRENKPVDYEISKRIKCYQLHYGTKNKLLILIKRFKQVRKYVKEINPDVIIAFMWDINLFTILACLGLHKKIIISERAHPKVKNKSILINICRTFGQKYLYHLANKIVLQTEQVKQYYPKRIQKKCIVIPNPINPILPERWNGDREKIIVAAGRLTEQKNFSMLIKAYARFYKKHQEYELVIYGEGPLKEELIQEAKKLNVDKFVKFPGYVSDVNQKMLKAGIYVSSSNFEGISNSMLEALAMGIPSICTDCPVGGAAMTIKDGENGILIPVGDEDALYEALVKIVENPDFADKISTEAIKVKERFSQEKLFDMWKEI